MVHEGKVLVPRCWLLGKKKGDRRQATGCRQKGAGYMESIRKIIVFFVEDNSPAERLRTQLSGKFVTKRR